MSLQRCADLSALGLEALGWESFDQDSFFYQHETVVVMQAARRFKRLPTSWIQDQLQKEQRIFDTPLTPFEKKQLKQRIVDQCLPSLLIEKTLIPVMMDWKNNILAVSSSSSALNEKLVRLMRDTFPGIVLEPLWSADLLRKALKRGWQQHHWPQGMQPSGDAVLVHPQGTYQKIRFSHISELTVIEDCLLHGYVVEGLRLSREDGFSCFVSSKGFLQSIRYPGVQELESAPIEPALDWLPYLEFNAWCEHIGAWLREIE